MQRLSIFLCGLFVGSLFGIAPIPADTQTAPQSEHLAIGAPQRFEQQLVRRGFVLMHDSVRKTPTWAAYHLTPDYLKKPGARLPGSAFKADPDLAKGERAEMADYLRSGFDRGHMVPSGDMRRTDAVQAESFYLSNMAPQAGELNRHSWAALEEQVREWVAESDEAYVYVGPINGSKLKTIGKGRVVVPDAFFKVVACKLRTHAVDNGERQWHAIGFVAVNDKDTGNDHAEDWITSIADIELLTGHRFLTGLPADVRERLKARTPKDLGDW